MKAELVYQAMVNEAESEINRLLALLARVYRVQWKNSP